MLSRKIDPYIINILFFVINDVKLKQEKCAIFPNCQVSDGNFLLVENYTNLNIYEDRVKSRETIWNRKKNKSY